MSFSTTYTTFKQFKNRAPRPLPGINLREVLAYKLSKQQNGVKSDKQPPESQKFFVTESIKKLLEPKLHINEAFEITQHELESQMHSEIQDTSSILVKFKTRHKSVGDRSSSVIKKFIKKHAPLEAIDLWERQLNEISYSIF